MDSNQKAVSSGMISIDSNSNHDTATLQPGQENPVVNLQEFTTVYIITHNSHYLGWKRNLLGKAFDAFLFADFANGKDVNLINRLHWIDADHFQIVHQKFPYSAFSIAADLSITNKRGAIFRVVSPVWIDSHKFQCYIECENGKMLWYDKRFFGWELKNDSTGRSAWELFQIQKF